MTVASGTRGRPLPSPGLAWEPGHTPFAQRFGDVYYSRDGGLAQARHVFLDGCGLPQAWRETQDFTISELGFGTGLNFLATWALWRAARRPGTRLHYLAVEGFPLTPSELNECLAPWPELSVLAKALLRAYPHPQPGFHRLFPRVGSGDTPDVHLTLLFGDVVEVLKQVEARVDAWFLDGFAPEKNPEMWRADVLAEVGRLSHGGRGGTCLATYSVASDVRRGLDAAGFDVTKSPGHGQKREMLRGRFRSREAGTSHTLLQPWFMRSPSARATRGHAAIIGGGVAGTSIAHALSRRGWLTTVIDRRSALADEASGNPVGVLMPRMTAAPALDGRFYASAWRFAMQMLEEISDAGLPLNRSRCGLLQLATSPEEVARQQTIAATGPLPEPLLFQLNAREASDAAGWTLPYGALYFAHGGYLQPRDLCSALAAQSRVLLGVDVAAVQHVAGMWQVLDDAGRVHAHADVVVLANALGALRLPVTKWLPLQARRGQITLAPPTAASAALRSVLVYGGYVTPAHRGVHSLGATFDWVDPSATDLAARESDHARNLAGLETVVPNKLTTVDISTLRGRVGIRCTSPDHLPVVGPVPDQGAYLRDFAELRHGHPWTRYPAASYQPGLYLLTALGSRGLIAAPLAAEVLACHITGEPWPIERDLITALHPGRFLVRDLKRQDA